MTKTAGIDQSAAATGPGDPDLPDDEIAGLCSPGDDGPQIERVTVNLTQRAVRALETLTRLTGDTRTDAVNRALQVHAFLEQTLAGGGGVQVRRSPESEFERMNVA